MDFDTLFKAFSSNAAVAMAVVELIFIGLLLKYIAGLHKDAIDLALKIAPLAGDLSKAVDTAERIVLHSKGTQ